MIDWLRRWFAGKPATPPPLAAPLPAPVVKGKARSPKRPEEKAILSGKAPTGLHARAIELSGITQPITLPLGLHCTRLDLSNSTVENLPGDLQVEFKIDLSGSTIARLPTGLKTGSLLLGRCLRLKALPEHLVVNFLSIDGCTALEEWPASAQVICGSINARGCTSLRTLPANLGPLTNLDLGGCIGISALPAGLKIGGWLDLAGTKIQSLPESLQNVRLRWRGVAINARIAFFPETLTPAEILAERNAEVRRVMIERLGLDRFISGAGATVLDEDTDPGGKRQLLKVPMAGDEDLVCVSLLCPSTGRQYIVRVPPTTRTCRQAVAWTAGFEKTDDYNPIVET
jgi:hypothetical protein